jgi:multiple sugar transport system permease protein
MATKLIQIRTSPGAAAGRSRRYSTAAQIVAYLILIVLSALFAMPFVWLLSTSLKTPGQLFAVPPVWLPSPLAWSNYSRAVTYIPFFLYLKNTLVIALFNVVATVLSCSLVAYGFARIEWPGRDQLFLLVLATLMIPFPVTLIPTFLIFRSVELVGTPWPLMLPALTGSAFHIFLLRQFFLTIPRELSDAARIDGAWELQIFGHIILPLARPALAVVALFTFMGNWNDFLGPLVYLNKQETYTLAIGMYGFLSRVNSQWGPLMAAATLMVLPIVVLFFFTQRTFIQGITMTGMKG